MGLESILAQLETDDVTPVTAATTAGVTISGALPLPCTAVTSVTEDCSITLSTIADASIPVVSDVPVPIRASEKAMILAWLAYINEEDPTVIAAVLARVSDDAAEREQLLAHIRKEFRLLSYGDDRRYCDQCTNLTLNGRCLAAARGKIPASRTYEPVLDLPHRCAGYLQKPTDSD